LFPKIRDLPTIKGLLDLERQGYGFRAAKLCFKAQESLPLLGGQTAMSGHHHSQETKVDVVRALLARRLAIVGNTGGTIAG
jgi:hypothetical protein